MRFVYFISASVLLVNFLPATLSEIQEEGKSPGQLRLFGGTSTATRYSTLTSTIFYSCVSALAATGACSGRKRRNVPTMVDLEALNGDAGDLASSQADASDVVAFRVDEDNDVQKEKLFVTLTTFTTMTTTEYSTNTATTVSISYACR